MNKFYPAQIETLATRNRDILSNLLKGEEYVHRLQDPIACLCVVYRILGKADISTAPKG